MSMRRALPVVVLACAGCSSQAGSPPPAPSPCGNAVPPVGPVEPTSTDPGATCSYLGIPFAAPPVGALRWKAPEPAAAWSAPRPSAPGMACAQTPAPIFGVEPSGEDCLYLNVWVPNPRPAHAPVMVFIHGGAFVWGAGTAPLYDGTNLAQATGAVVVTINYRLGPFGFLSLPALRAEDPAHPSAGNYGIEDQIAALSWVRDNIAAFGGDRGRVTIFGESAGGSSMFVHLVSPKSKGLFERVIAESAAGSAFLGLSTQAADAGGAQLAKALGCTDPASELSCLRGKPTADVLGAVTPKAALDPTAIDDPTHVWWVPVIDGFVLPDDPNKLFAAGALAKVPTLVGDNHDEATLFLVAPPTSDAGYEQLMDGYFPGHGAQVAARYPIASFAGSYHDAAVQAVTDGIFMCPARRVARAVAAAGAPIFRYDFVHAIDFIIHDLGAFHGSELPFVFGNKLATTALTDAEQPLSQAIMGYWSSLAANGDPNGAGRFSWPSYGAGEQQIVLDLNPSTESAYHAAACDFWDGL